MSISHSSDHPPISDPGTLLANLPAIFGFYPADSVVFVCLMKTAPTRYASGPIVRVDVDDPTALAMLNTVDSPLHDADLILGFIIADQIGDDVSPVVAADIPGLDPDIESKLLGLWGCSAIAAGEPFRVLYGDPAVLHPEWVEGTIGSITGSAAMQPWISAGQLPEITREDLHEHFGSANPYLDPAEAAQLQARGSDTASTLVDGYLHRGGMTVPAMQVVAEFLMDVGDAGSTGATVRELQTDPDVLGRAAVICGNLTLRDAVVVQVVENPEPAARVLAAAASTFTGTPRAHALALYALARIAGDLPMLAAPALVAALEADPGHTLTRLIQRFLDAGTLDRLVVAVTEGSRKARLRLDGPEEESRCA